MSPALWDLIDALVPALLAAEARTLREKMNEVEAARMMAVEILERMRQRFMRKDNE